MDDMDMDMEQQRGQADARRARRAWIEALAAVERDEVKVVGGFYQHKGKARQGQARQGKARRQREWATALLLPDGRGF